MEQTNSETGTEPVLTKKEQKAIKREEREAERNRRIRSRNLKKNLKRGIILAIVVFAVIGIGKMMQQSAATSAVVATESMIIKTDDWVKGSTESPVVLVEYLDFECEACGAYYPLVKRISEEYGDKVTFVTRYFPLPGHQNSMTSALAVEAAGRQGKYWEMHDLLFEEQKNWGERPAADPAIFEEYAKQLGLDMERFAQDIDSEEVRDRIIRDRDEGNRLGVNGTPSFFLNGNKIDNPRGYEAFIALLEGALQEY